ncbi:MAG TPA: AraC family transcriptional regulator [Pyrinomonadaceae bacterium]|jgi:AraC family transcriptional regulator|nr:AraC family transcriptional regulator [Pyrinomonadaceae bacterium]
MIHKLEAGSFFGETIRDRTLSGLTFRESRYAPNLKLPRHEHECAYFCYVLRGSYDETCGSRLQACRPSSLIFHNRHEAHTDRFHGEGAQLLSVELRPHWIESLSEGSTIVNGLCDFHSRVSSHLAVKIWDELRNDDTAAPIALEGLTLELIATTARNVRAGREPGIPRRIRRAKEYLDAHFSEPLRLSRLAVALDAHPVYLAREFRRHYRCTVGEYIRKLRINSACHQIATSEEPLVRVALNAGFSDQANFCRTFKRHTGKTPTEFRSCSRTS